MLVLGIAKCLLPEVMPGYIGKLAKRPHLLLPDA